MARIFARVRRELGPEAVIVQTRSLMREGAEPLIEVLATASGGDDTLTLALQRVLVAGSLDVAEAPAASRGMTIGDLEDLAAREQQESAAPREFEDTYTAPSPMVQPGWLEGFVSTTGDARRDALLEALFADHDEEPGVFDALAPVATPAVEPPAPIEWSARPKIAGRPQNPGSLPAPIREPESPAASRGHRRFTPIEPGIAGRLMAAGLSPAAAQVVADAAPGSAGPQEALESVLTTARVDYPVDNRTAIISVEGAPGSGRTTALMRMALDCADSGREAVLVAADSSHTGGRAQVHAYGEAIGLPVFDAFSPKDVVAAVARAPKGACVFIDAPAGHWSPPPIPGVSHFVYLAVPAHWHRAAFENELGPFDAADCPGAILTGTDIATTLTPAISLLIESGLGIAFLSSGRDVGTGITVAEPFTLASGVFTTSTRETSNGRLAVTA